jgi:serine protease Do
MWALTWWLLAADPRRTPVVEAVERATPAVVTIRVEVVSSGGLPFAPPRPSESMGSGVVFDASGLVLTNAHVVQGARGVEVTLADGRSFVAQLVAADAGLDLAVLRLEGAAGLPTIALGDSSDLLLGEPAIAIGNPYGLGLTVSTGVIASVGRDVSAGRGPTQTYIQTDAAINPGNSGGALVNIRGELIGINTFVHSAGEGIGFAIPVNRARKIADDLRSFGTVQVPWLGADLVDGPRQRGDVEAAPRVARLTPGGPLDRAGARVGEWVTEVDGHRVGTRSDVNARLAERAPGAEVALSLQGEAGVRRIAVRTGTAPADIGRASIAVGLGIEVAAQDGRLTVVTATPDGSWSRARLVPGDVIVAVDGRRVSDPAGLEALVAAARAQHRGWAWVTVERDGARGTLELTL